MEIHEIKSRLQQHLSDGLVTVVGSGLSCAEDLPSMSQLADHLLATVGSGLDGEDSSKWSEIMPLINKNGLEAALLEKAPTAKLETTIASKTASLFAAQERIIISEVFHGKRKLRFTRLVAHLLKPTTGLMVITTNYDRLIEIAVEEAGVGADTMFSGRFAGILNERESRLSFCRNVSLKKNKAKLHYQLRAQICKPHGSLDWYLRNGQPVCYAGDLPDVARLIITPGHNKFRNGYESPFDHHRTKANRAIDQASRFLIIGYGFNDDHLETHLTPAIKGGKPTLMLTKTLSQKALTLAENYSNVIALDGIDQKGVSGTRLIIEKKSHFIPDVDYWEIHSFITGVLEP